MLEIFLEAFNTYFLPIIVTALAGFFAWLGTAIKNKYNEKINTDLKRKIVEDVVKFVEQISVDLKGPEKFQLAKEKAIEWLNDKNIKVSEVEIEILIESFCNALNDNKIPKLNEVEKETEQK